MQAHQERRLLDRDGVLSVLHLIGEELQQLIDTHQLLPIRIVGLERFDSKDVYQLIDSYKATASRRIQ